MTGVPLIGVLQRPGAGGGGAQLLDAVLAEVVAIQDGRVHRIAREPVDPLLAGVADEVERRRRPPKVKRLVKRLAARRRFERVRDRLVEAAVLGVARRRFPGVFPLTRHPVGDMAAVTATRQAARALLLGERDAGDAAVREVLLAALAKSVNAIDVLIERSERGRAAERAEAFAEGHGVPATVGEVVREAQAATVAAVSAVTAMNASLSSRSS